MIKPTSLVLTYKAYADVDLERIAAERGFKTEDIQTIATKWNDIYITLKDGQDIDVEDVIGEINTDAKRPSSMVLYGHQGRSFIEDDASFICVDDKATLRTNSDAIPMIEAVLKATPSARFEVKDGFLYDKGRKVHIVQDNLAYYMKVIMEEQEG